MNKERQLVSPFLFFPVRFPELCEMMQTLRSVLYFSQINLDIPQKEGPALYKVDEFFGNFDR